MNQLQMLKGKEVEIDFHGTRYTGLLVDIGDEDVFLKSGDNLFSLSMAEVSDIRAKIQY